MDTIQEKCLKNLEAARNCKRPNIERICKLEAEARGHIAAMREYASKRAGKVADICNATADKWQARLSA